MAEFTYSWIEIPGARYEITQPELTPRGEWVCWTRLDGWELFSGFAGPTAGSAIFRAVAGCEHELQARSLARTEPTPEGLQYVIPGCEKDQSRGPVQLSLF